MLGTIVHLLVARRERLCVATQIRLLLRFTWRVTRLVLASERLRVLIVAVETIIGPVLLSARRALLWLLIVVRILLTELLLRSGDQTEIMFGMLVVVLGGYRVARSLRVACELDVFFRDVRGGAADFDVRAVRFVNPRQGILAFAVVAASPHALLTVSHGMPVCRLSACFGIRRTLTECKSIYISSRGRTCTYHPRQWSNCSVLIAIVAATPRPRYCRGVAYLSLRASV